ncbi:uncharacterized protein DUF4350 [Ulvibacter sp. MAR_2010_11]|nr:uncharacterized protein DUF4350 [Ulvibacter sp. MAR_2010_11]
MVGALVYLEATKPVPVNWFPSYHSDDKIPLGTFVMYNLLEDRLQSDLHDVTQSPFEKLQDSGLKGTYLFINNQLNFEEAEMERLLNWVSKGNTAFLSANYHSRVLLDTLQLEMQNAWIPSRLGTKPMLQLVNSNFKEEKPYHIPRDFPVRYFKEIDTLSHTVLGVSQAFNDTLEITKPLVNFIKAPVGKGAFYIHNQPEIFSNYFLLSENNATHTQNVLSYINNDTTIFWDKHYKSGKRVNLSPLYLIFNNKYLKWAYYFVLLGTFLFVLFEGKRKQRSIPIIKPLTNKTYEYTRTIAGMYLDKRENHEIAQKQIALFFEFIRTRLRISTEQLNTRFFTAVAARSGNTVEDTKNLFTFIEKIKHQATTSQEELLKLNNEITSYKKKIDGKS